MFHFKKQIYPRLRAKDTILGTNVSAATFLLFVGTIGLNDQSIEPSLNNFSSNLDWLTTVLLELIDLVCDCECVLVRVFIRVCILY